MYFISEYICFFTFFSIILHIGGILIGESFITFSLFLYAIVRCKANVSDDRGQKCRERKSRFILRHCSNTALESEQTTKRLAPKFCPVCSRYRERFWKHVQSRYFSFLSRILGERGQLKYSINVENNFPLEKFSIVNILRRMLNTSVLSSDL